MLRSRAFILGVVSFTLALAAFFDLRYPSSVHAPPHIRSFESATFLECLRAGTDNRDDRDFWNDGGAVRFWAHNASLGPESLVIDIGGNTGRDDAEFIRRYNPTLWIIEALPKYAQLLRERFGSNPKVTVLMRGVDYRNGNLSFCEAGIGGEASGAFLPCEKPQLLAVSSAASVVETILSSSGRKIVDLLTINCEGCEYGTLESLLDAKLLPSIRIVQFGRHAHGAIQVVPRYCRLQEYLLRTHEIVYQYPWCWEAWRLRESQL